jgi:hypothetical protein
VKKPYLIGFIFFLLVAMSGIVLLAQNPLDDQGNPNDPAINSRANACYTGGSLAGKCDAEWKWVCGWGIIRVEEGILNRAMLSAECQALMPVLAPTYTPRPLNTQQSNGAGSNSIFTTPPPPTLPGI